MSIAPNVPVPHQPAPQTIPFPPGTDLLGSVPSPKSLVEHLDRHLIRHFPSLCVRGEGQGRLVSQASWRAIRASKRGPGSVRWATPLARPGASHTGWG